MAQQPLLPVEEARARILSALHTTEKENVPLAQALGRVLAEEAIARRTQPPADLSAMDGYAVRAADVSTVPVRLKVVGMAPAGGAHEENLREGEAVRIFTGAPLPRGADTIVIQEDTSRDGDIVIVNEAAKAGQHVRVCGLDFRTGDAGMPVGRKLSPADIALAAAMNLPLLSVYRRPVIAFFSTGDELVRPGSEPGPNQIVSSNNDGLAALIVEAGGIPLDLGIAPDKVGSIRETASRAKDADMLVTLGGASVGDHDLVQEALTPLGLDIDFWKVAMRPGKPLMFGKLGDLPMLGLPGNPVSALVCATLFLRPAIVRMQGGDSALHTTLARLGRDLPANGPREDYIRAGLDHVPGELHVATPFEIQDSSMLSVLSGASCLIVRPPQAPPLKAGGIVTVLPLRR
ncbi:gephyrin-like molybdotransferase Glp [Parvibaculum sp.]|uniref:molybdopterin molybdotransferase MoeA n=1 Tax=Parvibaculum sp. TaxID=2024848 RepID=UPI00273209BF|nr:gephyrin-like molybdotransferase Glp [Parvibaculum sp.]MDP1627958.1 molybdopterin molybdotransferase MoeA [Parvibaculum sp.]MDP2150956.1 molybdopterin molybdotransferase MoeA [Parvibaculum sp.]MDP3327471.1 molybdopterin molybdotransferase MoeA [Parvibaculum sp.]